MAGKSRDKVIDGVSFTVNLFLGTFGVDFLPRLLKAFGPSFMKLSNGSEAIADALASLPSTDIAKFREDMIAQSCAQAVVNSMVMDLSKKETFDMVFQGKTLTAYKLMAFILEANYGDFLGGLPAIAGKAAGMASPLPDVSQIMPLAGGS